MPGRFSLGQGQSESAAVSGDGEKHGKTACLLALGAPLPYNNAVR